MFSLNSLKASMPATAMLLCMGLFSIFWLEARAASALAAVFPGLRRSLASFLFEHDLRPKRFAFVPRKTGTHPRVDPEGMLFRIML
jgi:hypothetical protein